LASGNAKSTGSRFRHTEEVVRYGHGDFYALSIT
jgi:hypothetical protein